MFSVSDLRRLVAGVSLALGVAGAFYFFDIERREDVAEGHSMAAAVRARAEAGTAPVAAPRPDAHSETPLWQVVDERTLGTLPYFAGEWSPKGRVLVHVADASAAAQAWQVGDRLAIPLPQTGETLRPVIDGIDDGPGYARSALGTAVDANGVPRQVVVTVGPASVFAYIDTPDGSYELFADSDHGWLLPTASMMAGFDFDEPDYILPGHSANGLRLPTGEPAVPPLYSIRPGPR